MTEEEINENFKKLYRLSIIDTYDTLRKFTQKFKDGGLQIKQIKPDELPIWRIEENESK